MRVFTIVTGLLMVFSCYAYEITRLETYMQKTQEKITQESLKLQETLDARLPARSKATAGNVTKHHIDYLKFTGPVFVIGDDPLSHQWLKEHAQDLQEKNAIGFITNITNNSRLEELQRLTQAPLLPANVDELLTLLQEDHYPFVCEDGELWQ